LVPIEFLFRFASFFPNSLNTYSREAPILEVPLVAVEVPLTPKFFGIKKGSNE
jgi:hypothetical protein